ncbi:MAG: metallophosphoesterase [Deltaproteobacteria bacterium]|nr:metallophosphoesterase [Deltaproteobacteria bacterium]
MKQRLVVLPDHGQLMVSADLHGNMQDLLALEAHFERLRSSSSNVHWVLLGDLVHGPDSAARARQPELYDFPDESFAVVDHVGKLQAAWPGNVHLLLGNHDHGHVGGVHTSKFHHDEVEHLESTLSADQRARLVAVLEGAALVAIAPCGVLLAHGSPDASLFDVHAVNSLDLDPRNNDRHGQWLLSSLLGSYGQPDAVTREVLEHAGRSAGMDLRVVVHGHDRDEAGFFVEGEHQVCAVVFGAPPRNKRFVVLDLAARYPDAHAFREGHEVLRLYPTA